MIIENDKILYQEFSDEESENLSLYQNLAEIASRKGKENDALYWYRRGLEIALHLENKIKVEQFTTAMIIIMDDDNDW